MRVDAKPGLRVVLCLPAYLEHVRHRRRLPGVPLSVDFDAVPPMRALVASLGLVRAVENCRFPRREGKHHGRDAGGRFDTPSSKNRFGVRFRGAESLVGDEISRARHCPQATEPLRTTPAGYLCGRATGPRRLWPARIPGDAAQAAGN